MKDSVETRLMKRNEKKFGTSKEPKSDDKDGASAADEADTPNKVAAVVGCVSTDKTVVVTEEFDLLFGAEAQIRPKKEPKKGPKKAATKSESDDEEDDLMDVIYGNI